MTPPPSPWRSLGDKLATTLVVVSGQRNQRAWRLPSVHLPAYDHGEADLELDQRHDTLPVLPPLRRVVFLDRGLVMTPPSLPGVRTEELIPGRLRLIEVPVGPFPDPWRLFFRKKLRGV